MFGPYQDDNRVIPYVINNSLDGKSFACSPGNQLRDFLYIEDVVNAIYKSIKSHKNDGEVINIGSQKPIKIRKLIIKIVNLIGKGKPNFCKIKIRSDEPIKLFPNISKAKKILNWTPKTNLIKGLKKTIKFYKQQFQD